MLLLALLAKHSDVLGAAVEHRGLANVVRLAGRRLAAARAARSRHAARWQQRLEHVEAVLDVAAALLFRIDVTHSPVLLPIENDCLNNVNNVLNCRTAHFVVHALSVAAALVARGAPVRDRFVSLAGRRLLFERLVAFADSQTISEHGHGFAFDDARAARLAGSTIGATLNGE